MFQKIKLLLLLLLFIVIMTCLFYFSNRIIYVFNTEVIWYEKASLVILLIVELFMLIHSIGYLFEIIRILRNQKNNVKEDLFKLKNPPPVAIIIPSYNESYDIIRNTLICCNVLTYPNKQLYLLDDTRYDLPENNPVKMGKYKKKLEQLCEFYQANIFRHKWRGAKAGILNDFMLFKEGREKKGSVCIYNNKESKKISPKYIAVLDVDQNPFIDSLEPIIKRMEKDPKLAFIQSPQYYTNHNKSSVANAANVQQGIFYEYICEGKSELKAVLCCGTNVVYNEKALSSIEGFDEISVTEDVSTSFEFHKKKWKSLYFNKISCFGKGPENLKSYFIQQYRWSLGTLGVFRKLIFSFFKNPSFLPWFLWWEYFLSSSFYFIGYIFIIISSFPVMFNLFGFPSYASTASFNALIFIVYLFFTFMTFILSVMRRGYPFKSIIKGQWLLLATFPVFIKAATNVLFNRKCKFEITSKEGKFTLSLWQLWPQLIFISVCFFSMIWGLCRLYFIREPFSTLVFNTIWSCYNFIIVFSIIFFNYTGDKSEK